MEQAPTFKRRRVALACKTCRNRKTRCDGSRPTCTSCVELGLSCAYEQPADPNRSRSLNDGSFNDTASARGFPDQAEQDNVYAQSLATVESTLRLLVENSLQRNPHPEQSTSQPHTNDVDGQTATDGFFGNNDDHSIDDHEDVDGMAAVSGAGGAQAQVWRYFGPSSNIYFLETIARAAQAILRSTPTAGEPHLAAALNGSHNHNTAADFLVPAPVNNFSGVHVYTPSSGISLVAASKNPFGLPQASEINRMLDAFFNDTALLFPFIHEAAVRGYALQATGGLVATGRPVSESALSLLNAIFAMTTQIDERTSTTQYPSDVPEESHNEGLAEMYCSRAKALLSRNRHPSIERVHSLLILCQYRQGTQRSSEDTCTLHAQAVRLATQMGLHACSSRNGTPLEREVHNRTWLNCIVLDRILSMTFGCPPLIPNSSIVNLEFPRPQSLESLATDQEPQSPQCSRDMPSLTSHLHGALSATGFEATSKLYILIGDIVTKLYDANGYTPDVDTPLPQILESSLSLDRELLAWHQHLPEKLRKQPWLAQSDGQDGLDMLAAKLSTVLRLRYLSVRILLGRATLDWFLKATPERTAPMSVTEMYFIDMGKITLARIERQATEVIDIIWRLSSRSQTLGAWWFSTYYLLNSSLALFACLLVRVFILPRLESGVHITFPSSLSEIADAMKNGEQAASAILKRTDRAKRLQGTLSRLVERTSSIMALLPAECVAIAPDNSRTLNQDHMPDGGFADGSHIPRWDNQPRTDWDTMPQYLDRNLFESLGTIDLVTFDDLGTF